MNTESGDWSRQQCFGTQITYSHPASINTNSKTRTQKLRRTRLYAERHQECKRQLMDVGGKRSRKDLTARQANGDESVLILSLARLQSLKFLNQNIISRPVYIILKRLHFQFPLVGHYLRSLNLTTLLSRAPRLTHSVWIVLKLKPQFHMSVT